MSFTPGGGSSRISTSQDVALNNPAENEVLTYDQTTALWRNKPTSAGPGTPLTPTVVTTRDHYPAPGTGAYSLVWSDTFQLPNGATTAPIDATKWSFQQGTGAGYFNDGWGNSELEIYTTSQTNCEITTQGLEIRLINQNGTGYDGNRPWTSAKVITKGKFACAYGRVEATVKVPYGQGAWPAFWMLGDDYPQNPWPSCGEIDIMEIGKGNDFNSVYGTLHGPGYAAQLGPSNHYTHSSRLDGAFHTYGIEWVPDQIKWTFDGTVYATINRSEIPQPADWVFDHPFYLILNVAVANGGGFTGPLDASTFQVGTFNGVASRYATMVVQSVNVYQK